MCVASALLLNTGTDMSEFFCVYSSGSKEGLDSQISLAGGAAVAISCRTMSGASASNIITFFLCLFSHPKNLFRDRYTAWRHSECMHPPVSYECLRTTLSGLNIKNHKKKKELSVLIDTCPISMNSNNKNKNRENSSTNMPFP